MEMIGHLGNLLRVFRKKVIFFQGKRAFPYFLAAATWASIICWSDWKEALKLAIISS